MTGLGQRDIAVAPGEPGQYPEPEVRASVRRAPSRTGTGLATKAIRSYPVFRSMVRIDPGARMPAGRGTMERAVFVYTTWPTAVEAEAVGRTLVERRLAACVNILPGMTSIYRRQGALERGEEAVMIIKTRASLTDDVTQAVKELHSYETPAILVMPLESVEKSYLGWLLAETGGISKD
jgi:periplasmic divalent cation tolerance protein